MVFCHSWGNQGSALSSLTVKGAILYSMALRKLLSSQETVLDALLSLICLYENPYMQFLILATNFRARPDKSHPV